MKRHAQQISPMGVRWLYTSHRLTVHSLFTHVCNLANENQQLLSIVTPKIGAGPFALVLDQEVSLPHYLTPQVVPQFTNGRLQIGRLQININSANHWNPRPNWNTITAETIAHHQKQIQAQLAQTPHLTVNLTRFDHLKAAVHHLAGRGSGLTPAGDDFLLGLIYALWSLHSTAQPITTAVADLALPRTTLLSGTWLQAAARGEAHQAWHKLIHILSTNRPTPTALHIAINRILQFGHSSGADALSGFMTTAEALSIKQPPPSFWHIAS